MPRCQTVRLARHVFVLSSCHNYLRGGRGLPQGAVCCQLLANTQECRTLQSQGTKHTLLARRGGGCGWGGDPIWMGRRLCMGGATAGAGVRPPVRSNSRMTPTKTSTRMRDLRLHFTGRASARPCNSLMNFLKSRCWGMSEQPLPSGNPNHLRWGASRPTSIEQFP
jgi:hypothetical protein